GQSHLWKIAEQSEAYFEDYYEDLANLKVSTRTHPKVVYENRGLLNLENFLFIMQLREKYLRKQTFGKKLKGTINRIPVGTHRNFRLLK
ncbi:MAG: hypothetical protein QME68_06155, partial [Elusimicrobiota bacterium]|nr:hypothetical protein [Elusimicrobiota bacterium]